MEKITDYYTFDDARRAFIAKRFDMPQPWINYLSNGTLHAFISQAGGGFAWWKSATAFRITRYRQYNLPIDSPGFYIYLKNESGSIWSPTNRPCLLQPEKWQSEHLPGKSRFLAEREGVKATATYFIAPDHDAMVWALDLESADGKAHDLDVYGYCEFSQPRWDGESCWGYYSRLMLETFFDEKTGSLNYLHHDQTYPKDMRQPLFYLAGTEPVAGYCGSRNAFMGNYRDERDPASLHQAQLGNEVLSCGEACASLQNKVTVPESGVKRLAFFLGAVPGVIENLADCKARRDSDLAALRKNYSAQEEKLDAVWQKRFDVIQCRIPDKDAERQINTWSVINSQVTALFSRAVNVEAPGCRAVGFRDSCQDLISAVTRNPEYSREFFEFLLSNQFEDGHCVHTCHKNEWGNPTTVICSDDHLWLPLTAYAIAAETHDTSFLEKQLPYLQSEKKGTVWEHLMAAVDFSEKHIGQHGILLTLKSDWNDIIGRFNKRGQGESVFVSQQYAYALTLLIEMADAAGKSQDAERLRGNLTRMRDALAKCAWDGAWWKRGFDDDGVAVGSAQCSHGKIFLNPQSWAVLGGVGTPEQCRTGLDSAYKMLETKIGLQLMTPGFAGWDQEPGETPLGYLPGCGENGAIFCHANTWAVIAEALAGNADRAWLYFRQLIPHNIIKTVGLNTYRAEPYAWCSNIVGPDNPQFGWGNVNQITGTAPWMDVAATRFLLGVRPTMKGLLIDPVLPADWTEIEIERLYLGCKFHIRVKKSACAVCSTESMEVDGAPYPLTDGKALINADFCMKHKSASVVIYQTGAVYGKR